MIANVSAIQNCLYLLFCCVLAVTEIRWRVNTSRCPNFNSFFLRLGQKLLLKLCTHLILGRYLIYLRELSPFGSGGTYFWLSVISIFIL